MAMQNHQDFAVILNTPSYLTAVGLHTAVLLLSKSQKHRSSLFDYQLFLHHVNTLAKIPALSQCVISEIAGKLESFYYRFDSWHCGCN